MKSQLKILRAQIMRQVQSFLKHLFNVFYIMVVLLFSYCIRDKNPVIEPDNAESLPYEKDSVIEMLVWESGFIEADSTYLFNYIDTLGISENDNALEINAVHFTFPQARYLGFFYTGNFKDMHNSVCVSCKEYINKPNYHQIETTLFYVDSSFEEARLLEERCIIDPTKIVDAYAYALDTDSIHSGTGMIIVHADDFCDTVYIDASINTADYSEVSSKIEFTVSDDADNLDIYSVDEESFRHLENHAIWLLFNKSEIEPFKTGSAHDGYGFMLEETKRDFVLYGFAPYFLSQLEEP